MAAGSSVSTYLPQSPHRRSHQCGLLRTGDHTLAVDTQPVPLHGVIDELIQVDRAIHRERSFKVKDVRATILVHMPGDGGGGLYELLWINVNLGIDFHLMDIGDVDRNDINVGTVDVLRSC
jgi:hypothetical protein